jgi:uncharacterized damage-inducible protein DinB
MLTPEYLTYLFSYNQWANNRVLNDVSELSDQYLKKAQGHSWGSVRGMLVHMMGAEWIWLRRLRGQSPKALLSPSEFSAVDSIRTRWSMISGNILGFIREQDEKSLMRAILYRSTSGNPYSLKVWQVLVHVANHATHHRGELAAMFSLMNLSHVEEDWLIFFLQTDKAG